MDCEFLEIFFQFLFTKKWVQTEFLVTNSIRLLIFKKHLFQFFVTAADEFGTFNGSNANGAWITGPNSTPNPPNKNVCSCLRVKNLNIFSNDELHIILKRRNLEICKQSISFQLLNKNMFNGTLKIGFFIDISWRCLKTFIALLV